MVQHSQSLPWGSVLNDVVFDGGDQEGDVVRTFLTMFFPWWRRSQHILNRDQFRNTEEINHVKALARLKLFVSLANAAVKFYPMGGRNLADEPCDLWKQTEEMKIDIKTLERWIELEQAEGPPALEGVLGPQPEEPEASPEPESEEPEAPTTVNGFQVGDKGVFLARGRIRTLNRTKHWD